MKKGNITEQTIDTTTKIKKAVWWLQLIKIILGILAVVGFCWFIAWGLQRLGVAFAEGWKNLPVWTPNFK